MANYFDYLKPKQAMMADAVLLAVGGAVHLFPGMLAGIAGFAIGPVTVQMIVGGLSVLRAFDMWFMK